MFLARAYLNIQYLDIDGERAPQHFEHHTVLYPPADTGSQIQANLFMKDFEQAHQIVKSQREEGGALLCEQGSIKNPVIIISIDTLLHSSMAAGRQPHFESRTKQVKTA